MKSLLWTACKIFISLALLTGFLYPLLVTVISRITMRDQADGSLLIVKDQIKGSALIAQPFASDIYFWPRPSAVNYNPIHSGGSNLGPSSKELKKQVQERALKLSHIEHPGISSIPAELVYASGSGLDPHISAAGAYFQINRVAKARGLTSSQVDELRRLIDGQIKSNGGTLGPSTINVLMLNVQIDQQFPGNPQP